jgi:hypothetical protein
MLAVRKCVYSSEEHEEIDLLYWNIFFYIFGTKNLKLCFKNIITY